MSLASRLGESPDALLAIKLASSSLAPSTYKAYGRHWASFAEYCEGARRPALPATPDTVVLFLAHLSRTGRWLPTSVQPILSAINKVHIQLLGVGDGPACGSLVTSVLHGWERLHAASPGAKADVRRPLPAWVASSALDTALAMSLPVRRQQAQLFRSLVFVALCFALMNRAGTDISLLRGDVSPVGASVHVRLRVEKMRAASTSLRILEIKGNPDLSALCSRWLALQSDLWSASGKTMPPDVHFFRLPADPAWVAGVAPAVCTAWLQSACAALGAAPPPGSKWTSHSLRKGAASAAAAIRVELATIRDWGGWAATSAVVLDYIDRSVQACAAARRFFRFLRTDVDDG